MFTCTPCNCNFKDQAGLDHHLQLSLAHAFDCKPCGQAFNSWELLGIHCESTLHQRMMNSPLNAFFCSWSGFLFHAQLPPHRNWDELRKFCCWDDQSPQYRAAWIQYQDALASEVTIWFGDVLELESWHKLCGAVGISPLPSTCANGYWVGSVLIILDWVVLTVGYYRLFETSTSISLTSFSGLALVAMARLSAGEIMLLFLSIRSRPRRSLSGT